ncbi:hypothetical protein BGZ81_000434 [Podila clonocystis]|nr:hypothetical protein BGZ81_000434 [Podila clonocystis]
MSHDDSHQTPEDLLREQQIKFHELFNKYDALEKRLQQLEGNDMYVTSKSPATTLTPYPELLEVYPAIATPNIYRAKLPKNHDAFDWNDFHYTKDIDYKAPAVLEHSAEVTLAPLAKKHDTDLSTIQGSMATSTRFFDTFAHELVLHGDAESELGQQMLNFLNTVCIAITHDISEISEMRENIYYDALGIKHGNRKEKYLLALDELAATRTAAEQVKKTYKKPEVKKDKPKKPNYDKNPGDKPKEQQSNKPQTKDKGYKSDGGYKSGGSKPPGKQKPKQFKKKRAEEGNDIEESD